jgi:hypothetical protein
MLTTDQQVTLTKGIFQGMKAKVVNLTHDGVLVRVHNGNYQDLLLDVDIDDLTEECTKERTEERTKERTEERTKELTEERTKELTEKQPEERTEESEQRGADIKYTAKEISDEFINECNLAYEAYDTYDEYIASKNELHPDVQVTITYESDENSFPDTDSLPDLESLSNQDSMPDQGTPDLDSMPDLEEVTIMDEHESFRIHCSMPKLNYDTDEVPDLVDPDIDYMTNLVSSKKRSKKSKCNNSNSNSTNIKIYKVGERVSLTPKALASNPKMDRNVVIVNYNKANKLYRVICGNYPDYKIGVFQSRDLLAVPKYVAKSKRKAASKLAIKNRRVYSPAIATPIAAKTLPVRSPKASFACEYCEPSNFHGHETIFIEHTVLEWESTRPIKVVCSGSPTGILYLGAETVFQPSLKNEAKPKSKSGTKSKYELKPKSKTKSKAGLKTKSKTQSKTKAESKCASKVKSVIPKDLFPLEQKVRVTQDYRNDPYWNKKYDHLIGKVGTISAHYYESGFSGIKAIVVQFDGVFFEPWFGNSSSLTCIDETSYSCVRSCTWTIMIMLYVYTMLLYYYTGSSLELAQADAIYRDL